MLCACATGFDGVLASGVLLDKLTLASWTFLPVSKVWIQRHQVCVSQTSDLFAVPGSIALPQTGSGVFVLSLKFDESQIGFLVQMHWHDHKGHASSACLLLYLAIALGVQSQNRALRADTYHGLSGLDTGHPSL